MPKPCTSCARPRRCPVYRDRLPFCDTLCADVGAPIRDAVLVDSKGRRYPR